MLSLTSENFKAALSGFDTPVLVDFWMENCVFCKLLAPTVVRVANDFQGKLAVAQTNVINLQKEAEELGIQAFPTLVMFKGGKEVGRLEGQHPATKVYNFVREFV